MRPLRSSTGSGSFNAAPDDIAVASGAAVRAVWRSRLYLAPRLQGKLEPGLVGWRSHKDMWAFQADRLEYPATI